MKSVDESVPDDVIWLILLNLPSQSIIRFKSVSKTWRDIISNHRFIHERSSSLQHLSREAAKRGGCSRHRSSSFLIYHHRIKPPRDRYFTLLSVSVTDSGDKLISESHEIYRPPFDNQFPKKDCPLICPAGYGIYCIFQFCRKKVAVSLWNPTIREVKWLPWSPFYSKQSKVTYDYGFANVEYKDYAFSYKVGIMRHRYDVPREEKIITIELYSSVDNSWKVLKDCYRIKSCYKMNIDWPYSGANLDGKFHCLVRYPVRDVHIIVFDFTLEELKSLEVPPLLLSQENSDCIWHRSILTVYDEKFLCLLMHRKDVNGGVYLEVWIMQEYGKMRSWTKLTTVEPHNITGGIDILGINANVGGLFYRTRRNAEGLFSCHRYGLAETLLPINSHDHQVMFLSEYNESLVSFNDLNR